MRVVVAPDKFKGSLTAAQVAAYAERDGVAVVELADVSGLRRLPGGRLAARNASSCGTGQVIRAALDAGCRRIVLGIGGSACTDGGAGMVQALGGRLRDARGSEVGRGGAALATVHSVDLADLHPALGEAEVVVASDVDNPLLGPRGAAAVYGPQKGASPADLEPAGILAAYALTDLEPDPDRCMSEAGPLLERLAVKIATDWVTAGDKEMSG